MKHKEVFKIYNKQDMKRNKFPMFIIALSIFLAMLVSLVIPQIQMSKQQYIEKNNENSSKADLMVAVNFPSTKFEQKITDYEKEGIKTERINISPTYFQHKGNQLTVYLLSGYGNLKDDDVIVSRSFANANGVKINDRLQLSGLEKKVKVTAIEQLPVDVNTDAEVAGYVKMKTSEAPMTDSNHLLFISGKNGNVLKKELNDVENGYKYYTYQERQEQTYGTIDKEMGALSLISTVGFILSIAVLVSGIIMLIIKSKKDLANLMLISIRKKDIIKAMKMEVNIMIFLPLLLAVMLCVPVSLIIMNLQNMTVDLSVNYLTNILKFVIFDVILFLFYRNLALHYIKKLVPVLIEKGEDGLERIRFSEILCYLLPFPLTMVIYSALLQSGISVSVNIFLAVAMLITFLALWIIISLISSLPIWKRWNFTLYTFHNLRSNKMVFVIGTLNLTMLVCFILIGFSLSTTLEQSMEKNLTTNIPYNYAIRSTNTQRVEDVLNISNDVQGYMKMDYLATKVDNEQVNDKSILLMNEKISKGNLNFHIVKGRELLENDISQVLISQKYANVYNLTLDSVLRVHESDGIHEYTVKGIYDSGGININWVIKNSDDNYGNVIYLAKYKDGKSPSGLKECYISNMAMIGNYTISQVNDFLKSFKLLSILFILSAIVFNINIVYMGQQLLKKDFAIMEALGIKKDIVRKQMWIKGIMTIVTALIISAFLYIVIANIIVQSLSKGNVNLDTSVFMIASLVAVITVVLGFVISKGATLDYMLEIREID